MKLRTRQWSGILSCCALGLALTGCDLRFDRQEVMIRHSEELDQLEVLLIYHGVTAGSNGMPKALDSAAKLLAGREEFMVVDWPLYADISGWRESCEETLASSTEPEQITTARQQLELANHFEVTKVGIFLDDEERLCGYQHLRIDHVTTLIAALNEWIHDQVRTMPEPDDGYLEEPSFSRDTLALIRQKTEAGTPWLRLDKGVFHIDVPMSAADSEASRRWLFRELASLTEDEQKFAHVATELLAQVNHFVADETGLHLAIGKTQTPSLELHLDINDVVYDSALLNELTRLGHEIDPEFDLTKARRLIRSY